MIEWISCKAALPTNDKLKLIWIEDRQLKKHKIWIGYYDHDSWWFKGRIVYEPTHWAEMPEGPKE